MAAPARTEIVSSSGVSMSLTTSSLTDFPRRFFAFVALQIVCSNEFVARQLHRCVRLPKSQFGPGHLSEALCKQLSSPASYSATQSDLALSEGNQRVADAGAGFTRCWPCAASGMYRCVALLPGSSGKGRNPSPPGAIWGKTCFVLSSHAKRPRGA